MDERALEVVPSSMVGVPLAGTLVGTGMEIRPSV